ncbi:MAG: ABC transporter ATP-binding protein [Actinomycetota bacterium]
MTTAVIECLGLTKFYGRTRGIEDLDLEIRRGELFGFLGPNGAGKTTTIRLLLDLIRPTAGRARVFGMDVRSHSVEIRGRVGYLAGELALYENLSSRRLFSYFASLRRAPGIERALTLAERLGLDPSRRIGDLSKGNKQKVGIVQAFLHDPDLLVLDEPTSGLDPLVQREFHVILDETVARGGTVFLSSHVLSELEHITQRVGIIRDGSLVGVEEIAALKAKAIREFELHLAEPVPRDWSSISGVVSADVSGAAVRLRVEGSVDALIKAAAQHEVVDMVAREPDLEELFLSYYSEGAP